jgi:myo-inositol-1(or 4)-monophosphatase
MAAMGSEHAGVGTETWLDAFRRMVAAQRDLFARIEGIAARTEYAGIGSGGDRSLVIDREAEQLVFEELKRVHEAGAVFTAISEERGEVVFGDGGAPDRVVIDPIDGSLNARRTIPTFGLSLAVASGGSMADVTLGLVHDFGADEEFFAERGAGAMLDGEPILARGPGYGLELVGLEASKPELIGPIVDGLRGKAYRVRSVGSLAITVCYLAAGRFDGMIAARPSRSVDVAAAQLIAREAGASIKFGELELANASLDLDARYEIAGGLDEELLGTLLAVQRRAMVRES